MTFHWACSALHAAPALPFRITYIEMLLLSLDAPPSMPLTGECRLVRLH